MAAFASIPLPLSPESWGSLLVPCPMTEAEWEQLIVTLEAMKPGLVEEGRASYPPERENPRVLVAGPETGTSLARGE